MPWCDTCDRFYNPNTLTAGGACPACGRAVRRETAVPAAAPEETHPTPWHFWVLIAATALYLGYRLLHGLIWVAQRL